MPALHLVLVANRVRSGVEHVDMDDIANIATLALLDIGVEVNTTAVDSSSISLNCNRPSGSDVDSILAVVRADLRLSGPDISYSIFGSESPILPG